MNKKSTYKNQMFLSLLDLLLKNQSLWQNTPLMVILVNELKERIATIKETAKIAGVSLSGVTGSKNNILELLTTRLFEISSMLAVFASRTKNINLRNKVAFAESYLDNLRQAEILLLAEEIVAIVNSNLAELADYGLTAADAQELKTMTEQLAAALPTTQVSQAERKSANEKLTELFSSTTHFLDEELDRMIISLRRKNPDLSSAYFNARDITMYGVRHEKNDETKNAENITEGAKPSLV